MAARLPPLNSLRAFEAAARLLNFTRAAEELGVTQGAISKQIKILEDYLNITLFKRKNQSLELTDEARSYLASVKNAFGILTVATDQLLKVQKRSEVLNINCLPMLSMKWLAPNIEKFKQKYPFIEVNIITGDGPINFSQDDADVAIRIHSKPDWKGVDYNAIMDEELVVVCSPAIAKNIKKPRDLENQMLLKHTTRQNMWYKWFKDVGFGYIQPNFSLGFEHFFMLVPATIKGAGVALVPRLFVEDELKNGSLVIPLKVKYQSPYSYYLLSPKHKTDLEKVKLFRHWMENITRIR